MINTMSSTRNRMAKAIAIALIASRLLMVVGFIDWTPGRSSRDETSIERTER